MRLHAAALTVLLVALGAGVAAAAETWTCWSEVDDRGDDGRITVTRCRLAGSTSTTDYGSASDVPVVLSPQVGSDDDGTCWYWTTLPSDWVLIGVDDEGKATLGIDPDGAVGGPLIIDATYPVCTSEPGVVPSDLMEAYELLSQYTHPRPAATLSPPEGSGVAGMEVFVADTPPSAWSASLVSPQTDRRIEVETFVATVTMDWGDGTATVVPPEAFELLTGWPGGGFGHSYRQKTCAEPGGWRCHPSLTAYLLIVTYDWAARYRVDGDEWIPIPVPTTSLQTEYDVDEIIGVTTAVG
jgi:hypothetical protein